MSRISGRTRSRNAGFTLLEVVLTLLLMTGGLVVLLDALGTGLFGGGENESGLTALNLAQEKMEELRDKTYANVVNESKAAVTGFTAFQREVVVTTPQSNLKQVSVNVYWYSKSNEANVGLVTYVSNV